MTQPKPIITQARVEAYVASALRLLGWLVGVILRIGACGRSMHLKYLLSRAEHAVECILFLKAVALYGPPPQRRRHYRAARPGFRRVTRRRLRLFYKGASIRARKAGPLQRVLALLDALANPERAVDYFLKRLCNGLHLAGLIAVAPPADALARIAIDAAPALIDSS